MENQSQNDIEKKSNTKLEFDIDIPKDLLKNDLHKDIGLVIQELLANANDGLTVRKWKFGFDKETPLIRIWFDAETSQLTVQDNGIGLDEEGMRHLAYPLRGIEHYVGEELNAETRSQVIGHFGKVFLDLMIADHIVIESRRKGSAGCRLEAQDQTYHISELSDINYGTKVMLELGSEILKDWDSDKIKKTATHIARKLTFPVLWGPEPLVLNEPLLSDDSPSNKIKMLVTQIVRKLTSPVLLRSKQLEVLNKPLLSTASPSNPHKSQELSLTNDNLTLTIEGEQRLTPHLLETNVSSLLRAISEIQSIIDEIRTGRYHEVIITEITQKSPISVSLEGASEAIGLIKDTVVPWRRKHAETMARLSEQEKQVEIELKKAEILEKRAHAEKERLEANKQRGEAERLKLENEKLRLELQRAKVHLAIEVLSQIAPNLSETDKIANVVRLLSPLDVIIFSELEISDK